MTNPSSHAFIAFSNPSLFAIEDKKHLKTHIKVVLDDLSPGTEDGLPFGPMPLTQEEQLSKLFAHELAFLNSSASSSSSDLHEQLAQDQDGSEHDSEDQDQEGKPNTGLEDLLDDTTLSETSDETSVNDEDRSCNAGDKELLEFNSSPSSPLTPSSPTFSHGTGTPPAELTDSINNDQALSMDHSSSSPSTSAVTHGPSSGTVSFNKSTSHPHIHTPSPLSQPPLQPQPNQEQSQDVSTVSDADASSPSSPSLEQLETLITPGAASGNIDNAGNSKILTTEEDGKR